MTPEEEALAQQLHDALNAGDDDAVAALVARIDAEDEANRERLNKPEALAQAAVWYAKQGIAVFPLKPGQKQPATRHGFKDATTDLDQVRTWWTETPLANIGVPTGHLFDVVDVDLPAGYLSLGELRDQGLLPEVHGRVITASGGTHLYIRATGDGNAAGLRPGVDYRGAGGYVVAPPSRTAEGMWQWTTPLNLGALT